MDILQNREFFSIKRFLLILCLVIIFLVNFFVHTYIEAQAAVLAIAGTSTLVYYAKALIAAGLLGGMLYYGTSSTPVKDGEVFDIPNSLDRNLQRELAELGKYLDAKQKAALSFVSDPDPNKEPPKNFNDNEKNVLNRIKETGKLTLEFFKTFSLLAFLGSIVNMFSKDLFVEETIKNPYYTNLVYNNPHTYTSGNLQQIEDVVIRNNRIYIYYKTGHISSFPINGSDDVIKLFTDDFTIQPTITTFPITGSEQDPTTAFTRQVSNGLMQYYKFKYPTRSDGSWLELYVNVPIVTFSEDGVRFPDRLYFNTTVRFHSRTEDYFSSYAYDYKFISSSIASGLRIPAYIYEYNADGSVASQGGIGRSGDSNKYYHYSFLDLFDRFIPIYEDFYGESFNLDSETFKNSNGYNLNPMDGSSYDRKYYDIQFGLVYDGVPSPNLNTNTNNITNIINEVYPVNNYIIKEDAKQLPAPVIDISTIQQIAQEAVQEYNSTGYISPPLFREDTVEVEEDVYIDLNVNDERLITIDDVNPQTDIIKDLDSGTIPDSDLNNDGFTEEGLLNTLKSAFIPREGYFQDFFTDIQSAFESKVPILGTLKDFFNNLLGLNYGEFGPPVFEITLLDKWGGGTYNILDFRFFTEYRSFVLNLIRFPAWFFFLKRLYSRMANIIY